MAISRRSPAPHYLASAGHRCSCPDRRFDCQLIPIWQARGFAAQAVNPFMMAAAVTLGVAIPALIYSLTRVGAALYIDCHAPA
jgi:hypothetical protein